MIGFISPSYNSPRNFMLWVISYVILLFITHKFSNYDVTLVLIYSIFMFISYLIIIYTFFVFYSFLNDRTFFKEFGKKYGMHSKNLIMCYDEDKLSITTHIDIVICTFKDLQQNVYAVYKNESEVIGWHEFSRSQEGREINLEELAKTIDEYNNLYIDMEKERDIEINNVYYESTDRQTIFYKVIKPLSSLLGNNIPFRFILLSLLYIIATIGLFNGLDVSMPTTFWSVIYIVGFIIFGFLNYIGFIASADDYIYSE